MYYHPWEQLFLWKAFIKSLPTNTILHRATCSTHPTCLLCLEEPETHLHALRDCNQTGTILMSLNRPQDFFNKPYNEWLEINYENNTKANLNIMW